MEVYFGMRRDYKGLLICNSCWDNRHWHTSKGPHAARIIDCEGGLCECPCRGLLAEIISRNKSPEPDYSQQLVLVNVEQQPETQRHQDDN